MADTPAFDAADLASAILELDEPATSKTQPPLTPPPRGPGSGMGWLLVAALVIALSVAISLAVQLSPGTDSPPEPPCGGLYNECCFDDDGWEQCDPEPCDDRDLRRDDDGRGLFDAEDRFATRPPFDRC